MGRGQVAIVVTVNGDGRRDGGWSFRRGHGVTARMHYPGFCWPICTEIDICSDNNDYVFLQTSNDGFFDPTGNARTARLRSAT